MGAYSSLHNETYRQIKKNFPHFTIRENIRPDWLMSSNLTKLELDLYIEEINTAIEVQGMQHYEFTPYFHKTYADFESQKQRDQEKRDLCHGKKVRLIEIAAWIDLHIFINELLALSGKTKEIIQKPLPALRKSALENDEFREEIKIKRAVRKEIRRANKARKKKFFPKLPGSPRQRKHAKADLNSNLMIDGRWVVWGGDNTHIILKDGDKLRCNCRYAKEDESNLCSHVMRIQMDTGIFPERKIITTTN